LDRYHGKTYDFRFREEGKREGLHLGFKYSLTIPDDGQNVVEYNHAGSESRILFWNTPNHRGEPESLSLCFFSGKVGWKSCDSLRETILSSRLSAASMHQQAMLLQGPAGVGQEAKTW
jgi:hypothetical protein